MPAKKQEIIDKTQEGIERIQKLYRKGIITEGERNIIEIIDMWTSAGERVAEEMLSELKNDVRDGKPYLNPVYLMCCIWRKRQFTTVEGQLAGYAWFDGKTFWKDY